MPSLRPFSSVTTYRDCPPLDLNSALQFRPSGQDIAIQIDITTIVNKWLNNTLPNYGLLVTGHRLKPKDSGCLSFGSAYNTDNTLIPTLDVGYKPNIFCLLPPPPGLTYITKLIGSKK